MMRAAMTSSTTPTTMLATDRDLRELRLFRPLDVHLGLARPAIPNFLEPKILPTT